MNSNNRRYKKAIIRHKRNNCLVVLKTHLAENKGVVALL